MRLLGVDHIDIVVRDLRQSVEFYRKFGLHPEGTIDGGQTVFLFNGNEVGFDPTVFPFNGKGVGFDPTVFPFNGNGVGLAPTAFPHNGNGVGFNPPVVRGQLGGVERAG